MIMKTIEVLRSYLKGLDIEEKDYKIQESQDTMGFLILLQINKDNSKIGILRGKNGQNLETLKALLRIVGATERIRPSLKIEFIDA